MNSRLRTSVVIGSGVVVALGLAVAPVALAYWSIPVSNRASAYTLGIRYALTSDNLHEIWEGKTPNILFRTRERDPNNKYTWQEAKLVRIGDCLDVIALRRGEVEAKARVRPEECGQPHKIVPLDDRFQFHVGRERTLSIRVSAKPPEKPTIVARGALFGVEGEIGTGLNFDHATFFKIDIDATLLDPADVGPEHAANAPRVADEDDDFCDDARLVRPRAHAVMALLPPTPARLCRYRSKNSRVLALVFYRSGAMQRLRFTDVVMCRALLDEMLAIAPNVDAAGCVGGRWGERVAPAVNFVLFDATPQTYLALFR